MVTRMRTRGDGIVAGSMVFARARRTWLLGGLVALLAATPAAAQGGARSWASYARLLEAHVRPGTIDGLALHVVDYAALARSGELEAALRELATARPESFEIEAERIAFWINAYNLLALKAVVERYPLKSIRDASRPFKRIWDVRLAVVAGQPRSLDEIEHEILRKQFREPRVHFAIVCASLSCPDLRLEPYDGARLAAQLEDATRRFLANPGKGVALAADGESARISTIFKWFAPDFGGTPQAVVAFVRAHAAPELARRLDGLSPRTLGYLDYDWSLNDAARTR